MKKIQRVVLVDDHTIIREGMKALLSSEKHLEIVGEAANGREAVKCVETLLPDLVLIDLSMPKMHGMEAVKEIKDRFPNTRLIVLTVHKIEEYVLSAFRFGADGYVLKDSSKSELIMAIENVLSGKRFLSPGISDKIIDGYLKVKDLLPGKTTWETLTQREREVLKLVAEGYKNKEIADFLCISVKTVDKHRTNLMKKLNLHNVASLTAYALRKGLISK